MPSSEANTGENSQSHVAAAQEGLACPRCDSTNTKFCYYNNYNLSQPRHFCKSCRRYWTHGGTLRDVPVGGGSRKTSKRSRSSNAVTVTATSSSSTSSSSSSPKTAFLVPLMKSEPADPNPNPNPNPNGNECASTTSVTNGVINGIGFTSLLNSQSSPGGFLALGGYGYGLEEISGFGYGPKAVWPFHEVAEFGHVNNGNNNNNNNTWQMASGSHEAGLVVDGSNSVDCFVWPDLSISMPGGNALN